MQIRVRAGIITASFIALSSTGMASAETVSDALLECAEKSNSLTRLVCFDRVVQQLRDYDNLDDVLISREQILTDQARAIQPQPRIEPQADSKESDSADSFGKPKRSADDTYLVDGELFSTISEIIDERGRRLRFVLANGQVWEKTEGGNAGLPRVGDNIVIRKGALGSFFIRKENVNRSFQVKRIVQD
jgi:hypothetical protein